MKRLLLALSALSLLISSAALQAELESTEKTQPAGRFDEGLFWSISKAGEHIGYLFGTLHSNDMRISELKQSVKSALLAADNFCIETFPGVRYFSPNSGFRSIVKDMMLDEGQRLNDLVDAETYQSIQEQLRMNGFKDERIEKLKPWAAMHALSGIYAAKDASDKSNTNNRVMLDYMLYQMALDNSATTYELETLEELMAAYYAFPVDAQVALLKDRVEHINELSSTAETMIELYLKEDLAEMLSLATRFISQESTDKGYKRTYLKHVLYIRNIVMAHYMLAPLRRKNTFIAVGALHLHGKEGVLSLLEGYGYQVKRVSMT